MSWDVIVSALLVLSGTIGALAVSLSMALLLGGSRWPQSQSDGLRWSGAVSASTSSQISAALLTAPDMRTTPRASCDKQSTVFDSAVLLPGSASMIATKVSQKP